MLGSSRESQLLNSDFRDILSAFCEEKVEFMLVGAYAVAAHGLPRATGVLICGLNVLRAMPIASGLPWPNSGHHFQISQKKISSDLIRSYSLVLRLDG